MILLDTHVLIWLTEGVPQLGARARQRADEALGLDRLTVSAITFWEVAMLHQRGRIHLVHPVLRWRRTLLDQGLIELPMTYPAASCEVSNPRWWIALARQFGGMAHGASCHGDRHSKE